jgi:transposase
MQYFKNNRHDEGVSKRLVAACLDISTKTVHKILQSVLKVLQHKPGRTVTVTSPLHRLDGLGSNHVMKSRHKTRVPPRVCEHVKKVIVMLKEQHKEVSVRTLYYALRLVQQSPQVWQWSTTTLYQFLIEHGFRYELKQKQFKGVFDATLQEKRRAFHQALTCYVSDGFEIFYGDETMMHNNLTSKWEWTDGSADISSRRQFMTRNTWKAGVCCLGSRMGVLQPSIMFYDLNKHPPTRCRTHPQWRVDFYGNMNGERFLKWWVTKVLPYLPSKAVVVLDNASYHKRQDKNGEFQLVSHAEEHGKSIKVLYLPPYSPDLNPIEMMWSHMKQHVRKNSADTVDPVVYQQLILEYFQDTHKELWMSLLGHCDKIMREIC